MDISPRTALGSQTHLPPQPPKDSPAAGESAKIGDSGQNAVDLHCVRAPLITWRLVEVLIGASRQGLPCRARTAKRSASARAAWRGRSTFGPHAIGTQRFATVSSGLQRHVVRAGHRCNPGETSLGQNPDKDEVQVRLAAANPSGLRSCQQPWRLAHTPGAVR